MEIIGKEKLLEEIAIHYDFKTIIISSPAGLGKTSCIEELINNKSIDIDELVVWRTQCIDSLDTSGLPYINDEKSLTFAKFGILDKIQKNPNRKIMLFVDEINLKVA